MKKIVILGASGSIGTQTLEVVSKHPQELACLGISIGKNIEWLIEHLKHQRYQWVCVQEETSLIRLKALYPHQSFTYGPQGLIDLATLKDADCVVTALVGFSGLVPTLRAIEAGKDIALANKETLVVAGQIVMEKVKEYGVRLTPIDSEHSAIFQALQGNRIEDVSRLIITASGGSFRDKTREELKDVQVEDALNHPNWKMGSKITIDSATLVNKAFEVIEAHWLFNLPFEKIETILHPESIIHSMVEYKDGSIIAQLGSPDMRVPIQVALCSPQRLDLDSQRLNFAQLKQLSFKAVDQDKYPLFDVMIQAAIEGGDRMVVANAANEVAVEAFLTKRLPYLEIETHIIKALEQFQKRDDLSLNHILQLDQAVRQFVESCIKGVI